MFQNTTYIRDVYLYNNLFKWRLGTQGGGAMFYRQKIGEGQLITHEIPL